VIHLINMPFSSLLRPAFALGQFKAQLTQAGIASRVFNFNFDFALASGGKPQELAAFMHGFDSPLGEWLFADQAWDGPVGPGEEEFLELFQAFVKEQAVPAGRTLHRKRLDQLARAVEWVKKARREIVPAFLDRCVAALRSAGPVEVAAFGCTFFQTIPSLALMRRIKAELPDARVVFGGACFHGEMGAELFAKVQEIDAVSLGESDDVIVTLFRALLERRDPAGLHAILYRRAADRAPVHGPPHVPVGRHVLEALPDPDFDEYFLDLARAGLSPAHTQFTVPYESSRGCWWGQKQHCTFCGLNGEGMEFREKTPERVLRMLRSLRERYDARRFNATDNILPPGYYEGLLPKLRDEPSLEGVEVFYEIKANLSRERAALLKAARVTHLQPGIESLSTHHLALMRKGVTALQNVYFLKLSRIYELRIIWNMLIRLPGETKQDYDEIAALIPKVVHLWPPYSGPCSVNLHRFSPYYFESGRYAENVRPRSVYAGLFPRDRVDLSRVAYYFDCDWKDTLGPPHYDEVIDLTLDWIEPWARSRTLPRLSWEEDLEGRLYVTDTRGGEDGPVYRLSEEESLVYRAIDDPSSPARIARELGDQVESRERVEEILAELVERGLAIEEKGTYLGLALPASVPDPSQEYRAQQFLTDWIVCAPREARRYVESC
jgi:ribosomal peptide maturation radical SAM protein 1